MAVVGVSGSGKTTLARLVTGALDPTGGSIGGSLDRAGQVTHAMDLRGFGDTTTVRDVLAARATKDPATVLRALDTVGLPAELTDRALVDLSGGERYRVAVAAALSKSSQLLVLDAPTATLDGQASRHLVNALSERRGALLLLSSDLTLVAEICQRVVVIADGVVVAQGAPADLLTDTELLARHGVEMGAAVSPSWLRRRARRGGAATTSRARLSATWATRDELLEPLEPGAAADEIAERVKQAFLAYNTEFQGITRRAARRFVNHEWDQHLHDTRDRLSLHRRCVEACVAALEPLTDPLPEDERRELWVAARHNFAQDIAWRADSELAETFFNSVTRRIFTMVGTDDDLEFRWFGGIILPVVDPGQGEVSTFRRRTTTAELVRTILDGLPHSG